MNKRKITIGLAQLGPKDGDTEYNLSRALEVIDEAADKDVDLIIFPELFYSGYDIDRTTIRKLAEPSNGYLFQVLSKKAAEKKIFIIMGYPELDVSKNAVYIALMFIDDAGKLLGSHRKVYRWTSDFGRVSPGEEFEIYDTKFGKIGLLICYEIEAPEPGRILALKGAEIILTSSAMTNVNYIERNLAAIAIQNSIYTCGVNNISQNYPGGSVFVDQFGEILSRASSEKEELLIQTIDLEVNRRDTYPSFDDFVNEFSRNTLKKYTEALDDLLK